MIKTNSGITDYLKNELSQKRLEHTYAVAEECKRLSELYPLSETEKDELYTAALLHDITKEKPREYHVALLENHGVNLPDDELESVPALHARTGAWLAKDKFPVNENIFSAIDAHTTGKENMSLCDKLLFLCDFIEPTRKHDVRISLRKSYLGMLEKLPAQEALDRAVLESMDMTIRHLTEEKRSIALRTVKARNCILKNLNGKDDP